MMTKCIPLSEIRIDGGTQPREEINQATVDEYADAMRQLAQFPALVVYHDGTNTWLADGFHRYHAAVKAECQSILVEWRVGTVEMARLFAASANAAHGLRRTAGDKRRAIEMVLSTAEGGRWTQEQIAKHCAVTQQYVSRVLAEHNSCSAQEDAQPAEPTKAEQKRARIAAAAASNPNASDSALARQLGVNRRTVAAVRATAPEAAAVAPANDAVAAPSAPDSAGCSTPEARGAAVDPAHTPGPFPVSYSTPCAATAAESVLDAARAALPVMAEDDWRLLLAEIAALR
jgi:ParB-like chromosome segregation protein Spo0J